MSKSTLSLILISVCLIGSVITQDSVVVITSNNSDKSILDTDALIDHIKNNQQVKKYIVDTSNLDQQALRVAKKLLQNANVKEDSANQLKKTIEPVVNQIEEISVDKLTSLLKDFPESVIYFTQKPRHARLLAQTQASVGSTPSNLFLNMTPSVLSGLFVGLFLIVTLLIGISCLYDIKTNDKFATTNLFVGRQS